MIIVYPVWGCNIWLPVIFYYIQTSDGTCKSCSDFTMFHVGIFASLLCVCFYAVLCKGIKNQTSISSINLTGCSLSSKGADALAKVIKVRHPIRPALPLPIVNLILPTPNSQVLSSDVIMCLCGYSSVSEAWKVFVYVNGGASAIWGA